MAREPRTSPIVPSYGESSLADLSSSILASLTGDASANVLALPAADRACLLVIDGLGHELLRAHQAAAPFLAELAFNSRPLTAGFPSTTVTSLASLGTGLVPAVHGMLGYQVAIPGTERLLNGLHWPEDIDPVGWQPQPTIFERARDAGVAAVHVASGAYASSGLTRAALRGAEYRGADSLGMLAALTAAALAESDRALVVAYHGDLDAAGHRYGVSSPAWTFQLAHVDRLAEHLASALPYGSVLYITADHGMVNVGTDDRIDADGPAAVLRDGVALLGGEPRARHVYARPGAAADVLATWRETLGEHAWVASREEAIKDGWFGPPGGGTAGGAEEAMAARIGDVVAACAGTSAIVAMKAEPLESSLVGMHGSLTQAEQFVPMLAFSARLTHGARSPDSDGPVHSWTYSSRPRYPRPSSLTPRGAGDTGQVTDESAAALITADELAALLAQGGPPTLLDVRWRLGGPPGRELYQAGRIPGAVFVDLDRDLAGPPGPGGRHPMPPAAGFEAAMRRAGVNDGRLVVVYDDADSTAAARAWWLLGYFGHPSVRVLDGGFRAWTTSGQPVESGPSPTSQQSDALPGDFTARPGHLPLLDAAGAAALAKTGLLLDARAAERYRGETEPVDRVAGHIPGAASAPTAENLNPDGSFRPVAELAARFKSLGAAGGTEAGVYCGSGVTAAHEALALSLAGLPAALYVGSWSNWITDPSRPIATGRESG